MNALGIVGSAFLPSWFVAWTLCRAAAHGDRMLPSSSNSPASANDSSGFDGGAVAARFPVGRLMKALIKGLPEVPPRMRSMPKDAEGKPVPYLLTQIAGRADSPLTAEIKLALLYERKCCWLCGDKLGKYAAFMTDPLGSVTRISRTPPAHHDCAKYAAQAGIMRPRDLRIALVWVTRTHEIRSASNGYVFALGEAEQTFWYADGRCATREEVQAAVSDAAQGLYANARNGGDAALGALDLQIARATRQFPPHAAFAAGT